MKHHKGVIISYLIVRIKPQCSKRGKALSSSGFNDLKLKLCLHRVLLYQLNYLILFLKVQSFPSFGCSKKKLDEEKSAENASGLCIVSDKSDNEEDTQELTDVFDDTVESLQRIAHPIDEQDRELCSELYNLLAIEGLKLTQEVMTATITRVTGKLVKTLTDQEKKKLKAMLPEESHRILESKTEHDTSFHVSYGLHRITLDEEKSPKSGWGNPVRETDIGIGDDVERLYRIQTIVREISNPVNVSVEDYIRLLDIMIEALTRLDPGAEFKEDYKLLLYKLESIKNPNLTQTMLKTMTNIVKKNMVIFKK